MKNADSHLLLTSWRVCLVKAGCFGIAPHKWEDHKLVLRHRRSSAFQSTPNIFIPTLSNCNSIGKTPPPYPTYYILYRA